MNLKKLKGRLAEEDYTKSRLARELGVSPATITKKLSGEREFTVAEAEKICGLVGITDPAEKVDIFLQ